MVMRHKVSWCECNFTASEVRATVMACFRGGVVGLVGGRGSRLKMRVWRGVRVEAIGQRSRGNAGMVVVWGGDDFFLKTLSHF